MMLAPMPALSGTRVPLANGVRGVRDTLRLMRAAVREGRTDVRVRQAAISLIWLQPEKSEADEAGAIFEWVRDHIRYVRDVVDVETLSTAERTLAQQIGDCDDKSVLLAAMLESVGYPTRFVVAAYQAPRQFEHVYVQVFIDGQWVNADPTERGPLGYAPPDPLTLGIEGAF